MLAGPCPRACFPRCFCVRTFSERGPLRLLRIAGRATASCHSTTSPTLVTRFVFLSLLMSTSSVLGCSVSFWSGLRPFLPLWFDGRRIVLADNAPRKALLAGCHLPWFMSFVCRNMRQLRAPQFSVNSIGIVIAPLLYNIEAVQSASRKRGCSVPVTPISFRSVVYQYFFKMSCTKSPVQT